MTATEQPRMTEEDIKSLLHALVDGKTCWVKFFDGFSDHPERKVRLSGMSLLTLYGEEWCKFEYPMSDWISWRESVEPRVWEGKVVVTTSTGGGRHVIIGLPQAKYGSMVSYRIEEVLQ